MIYCWYENDFFQHGARRLSPRPCGIEEEAPFGRRAHRHRSRRLHRLFRARRHRHSRAVLGVQCQRDFLHAPRRKEHGREDKEVPHPAGLRHAACQGHRGKPRRAGLLFQSGKSERLRRRDIRRPHRPSQQRHHPRKTARCGKARAREREGKIRRYGAHLRQLCVCARQAPQRFHHPPRGVRGVAERGGRGAGALLCGGFLRFQVPGARHPRRAREVRALPYGGHGRRTGRSQRKDILRRRGGQAHRRLRGRGDRARARNAAPRPRRHLPQALLLRASGGKDGVRGEGAPRCRPHPHGRDRLPHARDRFQGARGREISRLRGRGLRCGRI